MVKAGINSVPKPSATHLQNITERQETELTEQELADYQSLVSDAVDSIRTIDDFDHLIHQQEFNGGRTWYIPSSEVDEDHTWMMKCNISESEDGPLSDLSIGVKDYLPLAGMRMTCDSQLLAAFVLRVEALVVEQMYSDGDTAGGKGHMD
jgi:amidase